MILEFQIPFKEGLHARPATELVKICQKAVSEIEMSKGEMTINPKSMLGIMSLGAGCDEIIQFKIEGSDEKEIAEKLTSFFEKK